MGLYGNDEFEGAVEEAIKRSLNALLLKKDIPSGYVFSYIRMHIAEILRNARNDVDEEVEEEDVGEAIMEQSKIVEQLLLSEIVWLQVHYKHEGIDFISALQRKLSTAKRDAETILSALPEGTAVFSKQKKVIKLGGKSEGTNYIG